MPSELKRKTLLFLLVAAFAAMLLAIGMPKVELMPGVPVPHAIATLKPAPSDAAPVGSINGAILYQIIMEALIVLLLAYGGYRAIKHGNWKEIATPSLIVLFLAVLLFFITSSDSRFPRSAELVPSPTAAGVEIVNTPPFPMATIFLWLAWILLAGGILMLGFLIFHRPAKSTQIHDAVGLEAEDALRELTMGGDLRNVIVRCYLQMSIALRQEKGITLEQTMTAREFELLLTAHGFPLAPVRQLTRLFEKARYGAEPSDLVDETLASDCLQAIVRHSRTGRKNGYDETI
jgi:hypothetical protein